MPTTQPSKMGQDTLRLPLGLSPHLPLWLAVVTLTLIATGPRLATADELSDLKERVARLENSSTADAPDSLLTKLGSLFQVSGFLRLDTVYDDSEMNDTQVPSRVLSEATNKDDGDLTIYTRLTRLGFAFDGGEVHGGQIRGKLETDFYGFDSSDSRNDMRIRHAYMTYTHDSWELLAGQTIDLISPLYPSVTPDTLNWNVGNLGDRRPQIRLSHRSGLGGGKLTAQIAASQHGAITAKNSDAPDGVLDGEDSGQPLMQERVAFSTPIFTDAPCEVGIWGVQGQEEVDGDGFGRFVVEGYGIDVTVPITEHVTVKGEAWQGRNLPEVRGGVAQGINAGGDEIEAMGAWVEVQLQCDCGTKFFTGYSFDSPDREDVAMTTGVTNNSIVYGGVTCKYWDPIVFGLDYSHWRTRYRGVDGGENNRVRFYLMYLF